MNNLRPDEAATIADIERSNKRDALLKGGLKTGLKIAGAATGVGLATAAAKKVMPFLSEFVPENLAMKGIEKVSPALGKFLKSGVAQGLSLKSGLDYIKDQFSQKEGSQSQENRNIIQQYSPELFEFLLSEIQKGRAPLEAGALAQVDPKFKNVIKKMSEDHKAPFSAILQTIFGQSEGQAQQPNQQQAQGGGSSQDQIKAALQKIMQM